MEVHTNHRGYLQCQAWVSQDMTFKKGCTDRLVTTTSQPIDDRCRWPDCHLGTGGMTWLLEQSISIWDTHSNSRLPGWNTSTITARRSGSGGGWCRCMGRGSAGSGGGCMWRGGVGSSEWRGCRSTTSTTTFEDALDSKVITTIGWCIWEGGKSSKTQVTPTDRLGCVPEHYTTERRELRASCECNITKCIDIDETRSSSGRRCRSTNVNFYILIGRLSLGPVVPVLTSESLSKLNQERSFTIDQNSMPFTNQLL